MKHTQSLFFRNTHSHPSQSYLLTSLLVWLLGSALLTAQPSGGPYGPQVQYYTIPEITGTVYYVSPEGDAQAAGTSLDQPTSLDAAIAKVITGDAIIMRGGTYRTGDLFLNQSVFIQPYQDEEPIIKGSYIASDWEDRVPARLKGYMPKLWAIHWDRLFPSAPEGWWRSELAGQTTPLHKFNNDMVFVDGRMLQSTNWLGGLNDDTYYIDYDTGLIYLNQDPNGKLIEITAFERGLVITPDAVNGKVADHKGPTIRGIQFTHYAFHAFDVQGYYPEGVSLEEEHGNDVVGTILEHCSFTHAGRVGIFVHGDNMVMRHCLVSDTSTEGLYVVASDDVLLEKNIFTRNNVEEITGYYPAAVKIFNQSYRVVCNDNLVVDLPHSNGIWYDVGNVDGVFTNNWIENVGTLEAVFSNKHVWPSQNGLFFEISKGVTVSGNVFVDNDHGMLILNSCDAKVFNNTFVNSVAVFGRDSRGSGADHFGWHVTTGPGVEERVNHQFFNNLLVGEGNFPRPLLHVWQVEELCEQLEEPALALLDHNSYFKMSTTHPDLVLINQKNNELCDSSFATVEALNDAFPAYGSNSLVMPHNSRDPFKSLRLHRLELKSGIQGLSPAMEIPDDLKKVLNISESLNYIGAYPAEE